MFGTGCTTPIPVKFDGGGHAGDFPRALRPDVAKKPRGEGCSNKAKLEREAMYIGVRLLADLNDGIHNGTEASNDDV